MDISSVSTGCAVGRVASELPARMRPPVAPTREADVVELSEQAREVDLDLVRRVRAQIEAGGYDTPGRLEAALDEMLGRIDVEA